MSLEAVASWTDFVPDLSKNTANEDHQYLSYHRMFFYLLSSLHGLDAYSAHSQAPQK